MLPISEDQYEAAIDVLAMLDDYECECGRCDVVETALVRFVVEYETTAPEKEWVVA